MLKISTRISLLYFFSTAVIIAVMGFSTYFIYHNQGLRAIDDELHDYAHFLTGSGDFEKADLEYIFRELTARRENSKNKLKFDYNFILIGPDSVVYESDERYNLDDFVEAVMQYDESDNKDEYSTLTVDGRDFRIYEYKLHDNGKRGELDIVMIAALDNFNESLSQIRYIIFIVSPVLLLIAALIGYFITKRALAPVRQMTKTAELITGKNLDERVPVPSAKDELYELALTLNDMIERLERTINSQKQFIADASHDFRTPLTIIRLELELALERKDLAADIRKSIEKSINELKILSSMAENLLLLARADAKQLVLDKHYFRLDELLTETAASLNKISKSKNISIKIDVAEALEIQADEQLMKRVITNALDNAIKFSKLDGTVEIELKKEGDSATIVIINYGKTITEKELNNIFSRFSRSEKSRTSEGFGLGLPIIKTIVTAHGGTVEFKSNEGINKLIINLPL